MTWQTDQPYRPSRASTLRHTASGPPGERNRIPADRLLTPEELWRLALEGLLACAGTIVAVYAMLHLPLMLVELLAGPSDDTISSVDMVDWFVRMATALWIFFRINDWLVGPPTPGVGIRDRVARFFWPVLVVQVITIVLTLLGLMLMIVPGVLAMVSFSLTLPAVVLGGHRGWQACRHSMDLVRPHWQAIFGRLALLSLPFVIGIIGMAVLEAGREQGWVPAVADIDPRLWERAQEFFTDLLLAPLAFGHVILWHNLTRLNSVDASEGSQANSESSEVSENSESDRFD